ILQIPEIPKSVKANQLSEPKAKVPTGIADENIKFVSEIMLDEIWVLGQGKKSKSQEDLEKILGKDVQVADSLKQTDPSKSSDSTVNKSTEVSITADKTSANDTVQRETIDEITPKTTTGQTNEQEIATTKDSTVQVPDEDVVKLIIDELSDTIAGETKQQEPSDEEVEGPAYSTTIKTEVQVTTSDTLDSSEMQPITGQNIKRDTSSLQVIQQTKTAQSTENQLELETQKESEATSSTTALQDSIDTKTIKVEDEITVGESLDANNKITDHDVEDKPLTDTTNGKADDQAKVEVSISQATTSTDSVQEATQKVAQESKEELATTESAEEATTEIAEETAQVVTEETETTSQGQEEQVVAEETTTPATT
ncbi:MAG: hypothetical protein MI922_26305, partial [Bacteroidales bacterium]|nr:hypothetical protein [Bacteroidales bacterium]